MSDFTPKTRLEKILCGVVTTAKTRLEKAVKYAVDHAGGGGGAAVEVETTISIDSDTGVVTTTVSGLTAGEAYRYALAGRQFAIHADNPPMPGTDSATMVMPWIVFRFEQGGQPLYFIKAYCDANQDDKLFYSDYLGENDPVVLHTAKKT